MWSRRFAAVLILLVSPQVVRADRVDLAQARAAAGGFVERDAVGSAILGGRTLDRIEDLNGVWLIRLKPSGYVLVAGSDQAAPIVGFSEKDYETPEAGSAFSAVLQGVRAGCRRLESGSVPANVMRCAAASSAAGRSGRVEARAAKWRSLLAVRNLAPKADGTASHAAYAAAPAPVIVPPFMSQHWNQWQPYNDYTPVAGTPDDIYRGRCPSGCSPTAIAQMMAYWKWPAYAEPSRTTVHAFAPDNLTFREFKLRFDGHVALDWETLADEAFDIQGDMRGRVAEAVRHPLARLMFLCESLSEMKYQKSGSSVSAFNLAAGAPWYENGRVVRRGGADGGASAIAAMRADICARIPVNVTVSSSSSSHSVVGHGWAEDGYAQYIYLNYGWGGGNDGYYNVDDSDNEYVISEALVGFVPRQRVQLDPIAAVSPSDVRLSWHVPGTATAAGFKIRVRKEADEPSDFLEDFSCPSGEFSDDGAAAVRIDGYGNGTEVLRMLSTSNASYVVDGYCTLTSRSVLTFDFFSRFMLNNQVRVEMQLGNGEWTAIAIPALNENSSDRVWRTERIYLGGYGGESVRFRIVNAYLGGSYYGRTEDFAWIDNFKVSEALVFGSEQQHTAGSYERSSSIWGLDAGKRYLFTVTPNVPEGLESDSVLTDVAGPSKRPLPGAETLSSRTLSFDDSDDTGTWSVDGPILSNGGIASYDAWNGGFAVRISGALTATSVLSFGCSLRGYYAGSGCQDELVVSFVTDEGTTREAWRRTSTSNISDLRVTVPLGAFAGQRGLLRVSFHHEGANYTGEGYGATFFDPVVSNVLVPNLPGAGFSQRSVEVGGKPEFRAISRNGKPAQEGFFLECARGMNVLRVQCDPAAVALSVRPSHLSLVPDERVRVVSSGAGEFLVAVDGSLVPASMDRSRLILTLLASDKNGTWSAKDLTLRFSAETRPTPGLPEDSYSIGYQLDGGAFAASAPTSAKVGEWLVLPSPERPGYVFGGWQAVSGLDTTCAVVSTDGLVAYQWWPSSAVVGAKLDAFIISNLTRGGMTVTLKALWIENKYDLVYQLNGGTAFPGTPTSARMGEWLVLPSPTRAGYRFGGWQAVSGLDTTCAVLSTDGLIAYQWWPFEAVVGAGIDAFVISDLGRAGGTVTLKALWTR